MTKHAVRTRNRGIHARIAGRRRIFRGFELLEPRRLLANVAWDGGGDGMTWSDAANWDVNGVDQGPSHGDDVIISVPGSDPVIIYDGGTLSLSSLMASEEIRINAGTFTLTGPAQFQASLTVSNAALVADGPSASVVASTVGSLDGATLRALNGGFVSLPASTYAGLNNDTLQARGAGSRLDLSTVTTLTGSGFIRTLFITAEDGGTVDLSGLTEITGGATNLSASGLGSVVDLSALTTFLDTNSHRASLISPTNGGSVTAPHLTTLDAVNVTLNGTGTLPTSQIESYTRGVASFANVAVDFATATDVTGSSFTLTGGGTVDLTSASTIHGASFVVRDGVTLALPSATTYAGANSTLEANGDGSRLDLSSITTLSGGGFIDTLFIKATDGGTLDLSNATAVTGGATNVSAQGAGSVVDFSSLTTFSDTNGNRASAMTATQGGSIVAPVLTALAAVNLTIDGSGTISTSQIQSYTSGAAAISTVAVNMANATDIENSSFTLSAGGTVDLAQAGHIVGASFIVRDGVTLSLPSATTYPGRNSTLEAHGPGSLLDLSTITTMNGGGFIDTLFIKAVAGGTVDLSNVVDITGGATNVSATGVGSVVDFSSLTAFIDTNGNRASVISPSNDGTVDLGNQVTQVNAVTINASSTGMLLAGTLELDATSTLTGSGSIDASVVNHGQVKPGSSAGVIEIRGDFVQTASGRLFTEIAGNNPGTEYDVLNVQGSVTLDGTLNVTTPGFLPAARDRFAVINYGMVSGQFAAVNGVNLSNLLVMDRQTQSTHFDLQALPELTLADVAMMEGDAGTSQALVAATLSTSVDFDILVDFTTSDGFAMSGSDYAATTGTLTIPAHATTGTMAVDVLGDPGLERNETFFVNLSHPIDVSLGDVQAVVTILNDDVLPSISIQDVVIREPRQGSIDAVFTVSLSAPAPAPVAVDFGTQDGTARAGLDYGGVAGTLNWNAAPSTGLVSDGSDGAFTPTGNTTLALPPDGIFRFTVIDIPAGVTVTFTRNAANTPAILLAEGDVHIAGAINISAHGKSGGPGGGDGGNKGVGIVNGTDGLGIAPVPAVARWSVLSAVPAAVAVSRQTVWIPPTAPARCPVRGALPCHCPLTSTNAVAPGEVAAVAGNDSETCPEVTGEEPVEVSSSARRWARSRSTVPFGQTVPMAGPPSPTPSAGVGPAVAAAAAQSICKPIRS